MNIDKKYLIGLLIALCTYVADTANSSLVKVDRKTTELELELAQHYARKDELKEDINRVEKKVDKLTELLAKEFKQNGN